MLAVSFFALIFSSLVWVIFALNFVFDNLGEISFFSAGASDIIVYLIIVCLPLMVMWLVFGYVNQYLHNRHANNLLYRLFAQMKKNQDYSDLLARAMIETEQQVKDGFILNRFDLLIGDMNELLAEIIQGCKIASTEQIEHLWTKVQNGGKWAFGRVIIEVNNAQPNFQMRVFDKASHDTVLAGTIMEFCARYLAVTEMLEKHDREKMFLNIIETGVMGKVFSVFAPISDEVRRSRENTSAFAARTPSFTPERAAPSAMAETKRSPRPEPFYPSPEEPIGKKLLHKVKSFGKKTPLDDQAEQPVQDAFSKALERSFGGEDEAPRLQMPEEGVFTGPAAPSLRQDDGFDHSSEPRFEISLPEENDELPTPILSAPQPELSQTQKELDNFKKEWGDVKVTADDTPVEVDENLAYPFGGWTDEQNYNR